MNLSEAQWTEGLRALGDSVRLRAVRLLAGLGRGELCNCEFVDALEAPQPAMSRHLKVLKAAGLVTERRDGKWVYYRLAEDHPLIVALGETFAALRDDVCRADSGRLRERLRLRRTGKCVLGVQKEHLLSGGG